jgi:hypothetical protein
VDLLRPEPTARFHVVDVQHDISDLHERLLTHEGGKIPRRERLDDPRPSVSVSAVAAAQMEGIADQRALVERANQGDHEAFGLLGSNGMANAVSAGSVLRSSSARRVMPTVTRSSETPE